MALNNDNYIYKLVEAGKIVLNFALPKVCSVCSNPVSLGNICNDCWQNITLHKCTFCKLPGNVLCYKGLCRAISANNINNLTTAKLNKKISNLTAVYAPFEYSGITRQLIHKWKYQDDLRNSLFFTNTLSQLLSKLPSNIDMIIPVPLHYRRLFSRKYNQAAELAKVLRKNKTINAKYYPLAIKRNKFTKAQYVLSKKDRLDNVENVFEINATYIDTLKNSNVLVIDDVFTTGATMGTIAQLLIKNGATSVYGMVIACVPPK